jgi:hypothetical protein
MTFLYCQHFTNPFENYHNADIHILPKTTFSTELTDTLSLFSNDTLYLTTTVPELIDSFSVKVSKNRFFSDTTIITPTSQLYAFRISSYDIGKQSITIDVFRKDQLLPSRNIWFFIKNQLYQKDLLNQNLDDSLILQTVPAEDNIHVFYTWIIDPMMVSTPFSHVKTKAYLMDNNVRIGKLYISDSIFKSPETTFKFSFNDTTPPVIVCINDGCDSITNTIRTPDTFIVFRVQVFDGNNQKAAVVKFDGEETDAVSNQIYSKLIHNIKPFTESQPLRIAVQAIDNEAFGNIADDTFKIIYDPSAVKHDSTLIFINKIDSDSLATSANPVIISGSVSNSSSKSIILKGFLNSANVFNELYPDGIGSWTGVCTLSSKLNDFVVEAYDNSSNLLARKSLTIFYHTSIADSTPPAVLSIGINGDESKTVYVEQDSALITIKAFDYGSGIKRLTIDNVEQSVTKDQYLWTSKIRKIPHSRKVLIINTSDVMGNQTSDSITIYYNRPPTVLRNPLTYAIRTDTTYKEQLLLSDPDYDSITVNLKKYPADMIFSENKREFAWTPKIAHTGPDTLSFYLFDGYKASKLFIFDYNVYDPSSANASIRISKQQNIPSFLIANKDTLRLKTQLGVPSGIPPYSYQTRILTRTKTFEYFPKEGLTIWAPSLNDTGNCQIRLIVTDVLKHSDTLNTPFTVIPPNTDTADLILKSIVNGTISDSNKMTINLNDSTGFLNFEIRDTDHPFTEKYHITTRVNNSTTAFTPSEKHFQVTVNASQLSNDTVIVTLKDSTRIKPDTIKLMIINIIESPTLLSGLERWFLPEKLISISNTDTWKDSFSTVNDLSGNGAISSIKNGLNGNPTIRLSSAYLSNTQGGNWMKDQFSIYIVARYDSLPSNSNQALISNFSQSFQSPYSLGLSSSGEVSAFYFGFPMMVTTIKSTLLTQKNSWYVYSFISSGSTDNKSITISLGLNTSFSEITTGDIPNRSSITIGSITGPGNKWSGEIAEIIQYNRNLSPRENIKVIGYLMRKYNLK